MNKLEQQILDYVNRSGYKPLKPASLAKKLGLTKKRAQTFRSALDSLADSGSLRRDGSGRVKPTTAPGHVAGVVKRIRSGAGFVIPHEPLPELNGADVFIDVRNMGDAHTGDEVLVKLLGERRGGGKRTGRILEVVERASSVFVGTYFEDEGQGYVRVDGTIFDAPVSVGDPGAKGALPDDKVVVEMLRFPTHRLPGEAVLTAVLGQRGKRGVDMLSIVYEFGLPNEFPEAALDAAREQADRFDEAVPEDRLDLTKDTIVTIDPIDARDFDDAISLERTENGHWRLGVHIADVSHFVEPGSPLDDEAVKRGTSVYLPRHVIPMLPEIISNGLASLQQGKLRYTKSVFIEFTADGAPVHTEFANTAIKVSRRFAYEQVMPIIEDAENNGKRVSKKVIALLKRMHELAMILRRRRFEAGALNLDLAEVKIDFNDNGEVVGAHETEHDASHQIIEEFMLSANIAVAQELDDRGLMFLRRVHPDPDEVKLKAFSEFAKAMGFQLKKFQSRKHLQALINEVHGTEFEHAVNFALLRSLKQAQYSQVDMGHYALAVDNYCHFTSPIRRYPDLAIHRLFDAVVRSKRKPKSMPEAQLAKLGRHCSITERRAAEAERELTKVKLLTFMEEKVGEELEARITGVEQFGLFCQGEEIPVEGMIHVSALDDDYYDFDQTARAMTGRRRGVEYRLGDRVRVSVARVDVARRELEFRMIERLDASNGQRKRKPKADGDAKKPRSNRKTKAGKKQRSKPTK